MTAADSSVDTKIQFPQGGASEAVASGGTLTVDSGGTLDVSAGTLTLGAGQIAGSKLAVKGQTKTARSRNFNIDNGSSTTVDDCFFRPSTACTIRAAYVVYTTETTGTVGAATVQLGTTVTGTDLVAATALENSKGIGVRTNLTLAAAAVAANTPVIARHTGIAATAAGEYYLVIEYTVDD